MSMRRIVTVTKHSSNLGGPSYDVDVDGRELAKVVGEFVDQLDLPPAFRLGLVPEITAAVVRGAHQATGPDETK